MVLGKLPVPGGSYNLDYSRAGADCACSGCGWGFVWTFLLSSIISLLFLPLFGRRSDIDSKVRNFPKQPSNQATTCTFMHGYQNYLAQLFI